MPTRRILEVAIVTTLLMHPIMGLARLWAGKTMLTSQNGTVSHGAAEIVAVIA